MIYEYRVNILLASEYSYTVEDWLNASGKDGWELVYVMPSRDGTANQFVFKRPKVSQPEGAVANVTTFGDVRTLCEIAVDAERRLMNPQASETSQ